MEMYYGFLALKHIVTNTFHCHLVLDHQSTSNAILLITDSSRTNYFVFFKMQAMDEHSSKWVMESLVFTFTLYIFSQTFKCNVIVKDIVFNHS